MPSQDIKDYLKLRAAGFTRLEAAKRLPIRLTKTFYEHLDRWGIRDKHRELEVLHSFMKEANGSKAGNLF